MSDGIEEMDWDAFLEDASFSQVELCETEYNCVNADNAVAFKQIDASSDANSACGENVTGTVTDSYLPATSDDFSDVPCEDFKTGKGVDIDVTQNEISCKLSDLEVPNTFEDCGKAFQKIKSKLGKNTFLKPGNIKFSTPSTSKKQNIKFSASSCVKFNNATGAFNCLQLAGEAVILKNESSEDLDLSVNCDNGGQGIQLDSVNYTAKIKNKVFADFTKAKSSFRRFSSTIKKNML